MHNRCGFSSADIRG